ncbi:MAG: hypothetical protein NC132_02360 [Corallococcus sp.]|nr:hypothetical protein [Corallococcus sp.]MCM1358952.1 hypothetical protein [Corallococcus sp.]MCM1394941.1 hypothetical protein [Corallococcus sp.]
MKRKLLSVVMLIFILVCVCLSTASCGGKKEIYIMVACREVDSTGAFVGGIVEKHIFAPGNYELQVKRTTDGKMYVYYIDSYSFEGGAESGQNWIQAIDVRGERFFSTLTGAILPSEQMSIPVVYNAGYYTLECYTVGTDWNYREFRLIIDVKTPGHGQIVYD